MRDSYSNTTQKCFFYAAIGLSKIAFTTTLLRLSPRRSMGPTRAALWAVLGAVGAFTTALVVVTWLPLCALTYEMVSLPSLGANKGSLADGSSGSGSSCVSPKTSVWTHTAYALCMLAADAVLVALPWRIVRGIRTIPDRERCKVALTMNLVGVAALVEAARCVSSLPPHPGVALARPLMWTRPGVHTRVRACVFLYVCM